MKPANKLLRVQQQVICRLLAADKPPATPNITGARGHPRAASSPAASAAGSIPMYVDPELDVVYSGESESLFDSKSPARSSCEAVGAGSMTAEQRGSRDPELRHELFGSSDESKISSSTSNRLHSYSYEESAKHEDVSQHEDVDDSSRSHRSHSRYNNRCCDDRGASAYVGTTKEEQDRNPLRSTPEHKPWMPTLSELREWYDYTTGSCRIPLYDSSRIHGLDSSAKNYRTEHEFYIDVFFRRRWYIGNHKRDEFSLVQV